MSFVTRFFDRRKVWKLLPDYPVYTPPHKGGGDKKDWIKPWQAEENYAFFLQEKDKRTQYLAEFLAHFDVKLELTDEGLAGLSQWMYRYGAYLRDTEAYRFEASGAFTYYDKKWEGPLAGMNIMWDASIFCGEIIVSYNNHARWVLFSGKDTKKNHDIMCFNKPCVDIIRSLESKTLECMYEDIMACVDSGYYRIIDGLSLPSTWNDPLSLSRIIRYYASNEPAPAHPVTPAGGEGYYTYGSKGPNEKQQLILAAHDRRYRLRRDV